METNLVKLSNLPLVITDPQSQAKEIFDCLDVSEATRTDYKARIGIYLNFIGQNGFNRNSYLNFKRHLNERTDIGIATKNKYLATAKIFLKELNRQGVLPTDITQNIKVFSQSKKHKRNGLSEDEIGRFAEKMMELSPSPRNTRLKALFCLLALQGLRQIEIIRLDVRDIDLAHQTALVRGKGKDDKEPVLLNPETVKAIKEYLKFNKIADGALFKSLGNRKSERITTMTIKREMKAIFDTLGVDKSVHGFRHYYVTTLLKKLSVRDVRKFSRHSSLEMLIVYDDEMDIKEKSAEVFSCFDGLKITA
jgi:integrase